jgi:hypothetical protein
MAKKSSGKESGARTSATAGREVRPEATSGEFDRGSANLSEIVQRLARDGRPGSGVVRDAALAMQRIAGNRSTAKMLGSKAGGGGRRSVREVAHSGFQGGSSRLPFMSRIQQSFGSHDISGVRSFTGPGAAAASRALSAEAYASGDRVVFADSAPGLHTVAHEAAHVIQQRAGIRLPGGVDRVGDSHERHADAVADKVVRGESAERSLDTYFSARPGGASSPARSGYVGVQRKFAGQLAKDVQMEVDAVKDTEGRYAAIIDELELEIVKQIKKGKKLSINPDAVLAPMIFRLENYDGDVTYETYEHLIEALKARGAILVDGEESGQRAPDSSKKFLINLLLPGSGDRRWRTSAENMIGDAVATRTDAFSKMKEISGDDKQKREQLGIASGNKVFPTVYEDPGTSATGVTYTVRGPGTSNEFSAHPSNAIAHNVETATAIVESYLEEQWEPGKVKVRIMGHSRNGVTAALLTRDLKGKYPGLEIESVIFDPVPGADANLFGDYDKATLPNNEEADKDVNSTVVYSLRDDRVGFNPMKVLGAKRLILTHYPHHAGIEPGFTYEGTHYKGLGLLDLPLGLFIDIKASPGKPNDLRGPIKDWEEIEAVFALAQQDKDDDNKNRIKRIREIVEAFLKTKRKDWGNADLEMLPDPQSVHF